MGFKENLKAELKFKYIPVKELADRSGVKKQTIDSYLRENGNSPSAENAVSIAHALGVSVEYLVTGSESRHKKSSAPLSPDFRSFLELTEQLPKKYRMFVLKNAKQMAEFLRDSNNK
jgi:transcriptional regulator with XRE-family HTH domain